MARGEGGAVSDDKPALTIRIGQEVHADVKDFMVLIRNSNDEIFSQSSSDSWAIGAMEGALLDIEVQRRKEAEGE